jgi:hypothetical protein
MEITCPNCGFNKSIRDDKIPKRAEMATCPKCKTKFQFRGVNKHSLAPPLIPPAAPRPTEPQRDSQSRHQPRPEHDDHARDNLETEHLHPEHDEQDQPPRPDEHPREDFAGQPDWQMSGQPHADSDALPDQSPSEHPHAKPGAGPSVGPNTGSDAGPEAGPGAGPGEQPVSKSDPRQADSRDRDAPTPQSGKSEDFWETLASLGLPHQQSPGSRSDDFRSEAPRPEGPGQDESVEVPWEHLDKYGFFPGIWETIKRAMLQPAAFFRAMPVGGGQIKPLIFYLLIAEFQIVLQMLWESTGMFPDMAGQGTTTGINILMLLIGYPIILTLLLYFMAMLVHICLGLVGGARRGFEGTFRALTYGSAPMVMTLIPMIGPLVGAVWSLVVTFLGYKHIHRTSTGKVLLAMLLPLIPFILLFAIVISSAQRSGVPAF